MKDELDILTEIENYRNLWYMWNLIGLILGIVIWLVLSAKVKTAHVKTLRGKLGFLAGPWTPRQMIIIDKNIYYDNEYEITKGEKNYIIRTIDGGNYTTDYDPEKYAIVVSAWGARGPEDVDSVYSLAWRWIIAAMILVYFTSLGLLAAYNDPRINALKWLEALGSSLPQGLVYTILNERALNTGLASVFFAVFFAWWLANTLRLSARSIKLSTFVSIKASNVEKLIPAITPDSPASPTEILKEKIVLNLTEEAKNLLKQLADKIQTDITALIEILNEASMAKYWRQSTGKLLTSIDDYKLAAEAEATMKMKAVTPKLVGSMTKIIILTAIGMLALGFFIGWGFGSTWGVQVQENTTVTTVTETVNQGSGIPVSEGNSTTVTPAPPPPPPITSG